MKKQYLVTLPNKILHEKATKVTSFNDELKDQINLMVKLLREESGVGLAANQVGFNNRVVVIEFTNNPPHKEDIPLTIFINPEIIEMTEEKKCAEEGCLSVPKVYLDVDRATSLKVKYQNEDGQTIKFAPKGLLARILQHEVDHINGTLFTDRVKEQYFTKFPDLKKTKLLFCGSGEFGARVLESLYLIGFDFEIITETAKPAGRKRELKPTPVAEIAKRYGIKYIEVEKSTLNSKFSGFKPFDLLLCADFGQKIPAEILTKPKIAAINIHPSLLPKYQGPTPIQTAILNGEKETGVTIIKMSPEIDKGPILIQGTTEIFDDEDTPALRDRLAVAGVKLLLKLLPELSNRNTDGREQNNILATKTRKFTKEDALIDWLKTPQEIDRKILAFYPWPGTYTLIDNKRLIVHAAHLENDLLVLDVVQLEGKSPVYWQDFISNYKGKKPDWFKKIKI